MLVSLNISSSDSICLREKTGFTEIKSDYTEGCYDYEDFSPTRGYQNEECYENGYGNDHFDHEAYDDDYEDINFNCN